MVEPVHAFCTPWVMMTAPKTTKNANTETASSITWSAWVTIRTSSRLAFSRPCTLVRSASRCTESSASSTDWAYSASGVPRHTSATVDASASSST